jgi:hypothetical protein
VVAEAEDSLVALLSDYRELEETHSDVHGSPLPSTKDEGSDRRMRGQGQGQGQERGQNLSGPYAQLFPAF